MSPPDQDDTLQSTDSATGPRHACHGSWGAGGSNCPGPGALYILQQRLAPPPQGIILLTSRMGLNYYFSSSVTFNFLNAILIEACELFFELNVNV